MTGGFSDVTIKLVSKDKDGISINLGGSSVYDVNGNPAFRTSAFATLGEHFGVVVTTDAIRFPVKKSGLNRGGGVGAAVIYPEWKAAGILIRTNRREVKDAEGKVIGTERGDIQAQGTIAHAPDSESGWMISGTTASNFWKLKLFTEGEYVSTFMAAEKTDNLLSVGIKGMVQLAKNKYIFGGIGEDFYKQNGERYNRTNLEIGIIKYPNGINKFGGGASIRLDDIKGRKQFMVFLDLTYGF
jgi:hypothetical protein